MFNLSKLKNYISFKKYKRSYPGVFRVCTKCKNRFYLTSIELSFYASNESSGPHVCRTCKVSHKQMSYTSPHVLSAVLNNSSDHNTQILKN